jgi:hypothetical protein
MGMAAALLSVLLLLPVLLARGHILLSTSLVAACLFGLYLWSLLGGLPSEGTGSVLARPFVAVEAIIFGQVDTLSASLNGNMKSSAVDAAVVDWYARLSESPLRALATAASRTLFAPYPWVAISDGLHRNGIELYYLGVVLWIICLPGVFWAIGGAFRNPNFSAVFVGSVLAACLLAYIVFLGEWSTRQRVFALPVFFALAAIGWADLVQRLRRRKAKSGCRRYHRVCDARYTHD